MEFGNPAHEVVEETSNDVTIIEARITEAGVYVSVFNIEVSSSTTRDGDGDRIGEAQCRIDIHIVHHSPEEHCFQSFGPARVWSALLLQLF